jgi:hypothetical protein
MKLIIPVLLILLVSQAQAELADNSAYQAKVNAQVDESSPAEIFTINDQPAPPYYGYLYGPKRTLRWYDYGTNQIPKILSENTVVYLDRRLVNEVILRAIDNRIRVQSVMAYAVDGQVFEIGSLAGSLRDNMQKRSSVDRFYSVRLDRIEIRATSPNLIGSRGELQVFVGLAD